MGYLYYAGETQPAEMPDRVLAHLKAVAITKLRRGESFTLSWQHADGEGSGRTSVWMQPAIPLRFIFDSVDAVELDPGYLKEMANDANSNRGVVIEMDETQRDMIEGDTIEVGETETESETETVSASAAVVKPMIAA